MLRAHLTSRSSLALPFALLAVLVLGARARADLMLTQAGINEGFTLTTFATGFPDTQTQDNGLIGPLGIGFTPTGGVLVSNYNGNVRLFRHDVDNQVRRRDSILVGSYGLTNAFGMAVAGGQLFMAQQGAGDLVRLHRGSGRYYGTMTVPGSIPGAAGITTDPRNGHLFVSNANGGGGIWDVNPTTGAIRLFKSVKADGLTTNGSVLYAAEENRVVGYNILPGKDFGKKVWVSPFVNTADGVTLGTGVLAGNIFVNTNDGRIVQVDLKSKLETVIAVGGSRGDFVTVDPNLVDGSRNTLLVTQSTSIDRLIPPPGGGFQGGGGPQAAGAPEPTGLALFGLGLLGLAGFRRWRRR
jgi:hypothetical protein